MSTAKAHLKQVRIKLESAEGVAPTTASAQLLRTVTSTFSLKKQKTPSNERRGDLQRADNTHGLQNVEGSISGEVSPGTYAIPFAMALRKAWAAVANMVGLTLTVAGAGPTYTLSRSAGSWLTDGIKAGMVIRPTAGLNVANRVNLLVMTAVALDLTVLPVVAGATMVTEAAVAACTVSVPGKVLWTPDTGHTDQTLAVEEWNPGVPDSALWLGNGIQGFNFNAPATGNATVDFQFLGIRLATQAQRGGAAETVEYFASGSLAAITTSRVLNGANGVLRFDGTKAANITSFSLSYAGNQSGEAVFGSTEYPELDEGPVHFTGQFMVRFDSKAHRDAFKNATDQSATVVIATAQSGTAEFVALTITRMDIDAFECDDPTMGPIKATVRFTCLKRTDGGAGTQYEATTVMVQDSLAP
jgi:hypothetical protein